MRIFHYDPIRGTLRNREHHMVCHCSFPKEVSRVLLGLVSIRDAAALYLDLAAQVVADKPKDREWQITEDEIMAWLSAHRERERAESIKEKPAA